MINNININTYVLQNGTLPRMYPTSEHLLSNLTDDDSSDDDALERLSDTENICPSTTRQSHQSAPPPRRDSLNDMISPSGNTSNTIPRNANGPISVVFNPQNRSAWLPRVRLNNTLRGNRDQVAERSSIRNSLPNPYTGSTYDPFGDDYNTREITQRLFADVTNTEHVQPHPENNSVQQFNTNQSIINLCVDNDLINTDNLSIEASIAEFQNVIDNEFADITSDLLSSGSTRSLSSALIDFTDNFSCETTNRQDNYDSTSAQQNHSNQQNDSNSLNSNNEESSSLERRLPLHLLSLFENPNSNIDDMLPRHVSGDLNNRIDQVRIAGDNDESLTSNSSQQNPLFEGSFINNPTETTPLTLQSLFEGSTSEQENPVEPATITLDTNRNVNVPLLTGNNRHAVNNNMNNQSNRSSVTENSLNRSPMQQNWYIYDPRLGANRQDRLNFPMAWRGVQTQWSMPAMIGPPDYDQLSSRHSEEGDISVPQEPPPPYYTQNSPSIDLSTILTNNVVPTSIPPPYEISANREVNTNTSTSAVAEVSPIPPPPTYDEAIFNSRFSEFERQHLGLGSTDRNDSSTTDDVNDSPPSERNEVHLIRGPIIIPNSTQRTLLGILNEDRLNQLSSHNHPADLSELDVIGINAQFSSMSDINTENNTSQPEGRDTNITNPTLASPTSNTGNRLGIGALNAQFRLGILNNPNFHMFASCNQERSDPELRNNRTPVIIPNSTQQALISILNEENIRQQHEAGLDDNALMELDTLDFTNTLSIDNNNDDDHELERSEDGVHTAENSELAGTQFAQSRFWSRPRWGQQTQSGTGSNFGISCRLRNVSENRY